MRFSALHAPTLKEAPKEAEVPSHRLLIRGGYIRKLAAGIYDFLPLAVRSIEKLKRILREELHRGGAQEVLLPAVQPAELWMESNRWQQYGPELLRFEDRKGSPFCLGPTHEEVIVDLVRRDVRSYRQLPLNLYQIQAKFRDEMRPRAGLMRGREFMMKDGYSFDVDDASARESYRRMHDAYVRIFRRCGLDFRVVDADPGNIGGSLSQEFQVLAETGEDSIVSCSSCSYTANIEKAELPAPQAAEGPRAAGDMERVATPGKRTIEEVSRFLRVESAALVKTLLYRVDGRLVAVLVRGDHELNEIKLKNALGAEALHLADEETVREATGAPVGFAGPVDLPRGVLVIADNAVAALSELIVGGNEADLHLRRVNQPRDFQVTRFLDIRLAQAGDPCARCGGELRFFRGIEVGHIFFLGTKYSEPMKCNFLDESGQERPMVMGCYGIGVTRVLAAAIEQHNDANGIRWPAPLAPYHVSVIALSMHEADVRDRSQAIYEGLLERGVEVLFDDRDERPGAKLKDADLMGFPFQVVVGRKGLERGGVEVKRRATGEAELVPVEDAVARIGDLVLEELARWQ